MAHQDLPPVTRSGKPPSEIRLGKDHAVVYLNRGLTAMIDLQDIPTVSGYRWAALVLASGHAYAVRYEKGTYVSMHRQLLAAPTGTYVDHIDGDGLNNRRANIRLATASQNQANKVVERRNKLGIKGISERGVRYEATIKPAGKSIYLGTYATKAEAAAAYRGAAKALWGEFARE